MLLAIFLDTKKTVQIPELLVTHSPNIPELTRPIKTATRNHRPILFNFIKIRKRKTYFLQTESSYARLSGIKLLCDTSITGAH
ncbi:hypothetical protein YN1HA_18890 [Sulfurisphaera ohwakuensis]